MTTEEHKTPSEQAQQQCGTCDCLAQCGDTAAHHAGQAQQPSTAAWVSLQDRLPDPEEHQRVLVYTEGFDFHGEQFFDVETTELHVDAPGLYLSEVCEHASHWMPLPVLRMTQQPASAPDVPNEAAWKELALTAIKRMRAAHVPCMDIIAEAEGLLSKADVPKGEPVAWKDVVGFEGVYEVSIQGAVRRKDTGARLTLNSKAGKGYVKCSLQFGGKRLQTYLHRVVCEAFNGPANNREVNHIDGNKENNCAANLEWVSRAENVNHSYYTLGNQIVAVEAANDNGDVLLYRSVEEAVRAGFDSGSIYRCLKDPGRRHKGYRWYRPAPADTSAPDAGMRECRHCGWLCKPNTSASKDWYPMAQHPTSTPDSEAERDAARLDWLMHRLNSITTEQGWTRDAIDAAIAAKEQK